MTGSLQLIGTFHLRTFYSQIPGLKDIKDSFMKNKSELFLILMHNDIVYRIFFFHCST